MTKDFRGTTSLNEIVADFKNKRKRRSTDRIPMRKSHQNIVWRDHAELFKKIQRLQLEPIRHAKSNLVKNTTECFFAGGVVERENIRRSLLTMNVFYTRVVII